MSWQYQLKNPNENVGAKRASLELATYWNQYNQHRRVYLGSALIELTDKDQPGIGSLGNPAAGWMNDKATGAIPFSVSDPGLGVSKITLEQPSISGGFKVLETKHGCTGGVAKPCPRSWKSSDALPQPAYDPKAMPQGEDWLKFNAYDPLGQKVTGNVRVKADHTAPKLALSGTLTEQATLGTKAAEYALKYSASDGQDAAPEALSPLGTAGTGTGQLERPQGVAVDASGNVWVTDRINQRIVQYDKNGKFLKQIGTPGSGAGQINEPRGITVAPNGTIWAAEIGNKRLQQFNSKGEYLKTITLTASLNNGLNAFVEPWGIAAGPGETLWVTDQGADKIFRFREDGTFLGAASGLPLLGPLNAPMGIAVDSLGNAWATDAANHKVYVFNPEGKYVYSFGSEGTEAGKLKGPAGVAITSSGNILVADGGNNRIQEFESDGSFLRQFGSGGTSNAQFNEPRGIAVGADGVALVADASNRRIGRWSKVDHDPQSGVVKTEVKIDGVLVEPAHAPGCGTKNCAISREWVLEAADYVSGQHTVSVTATDAVGLSTTKSVTVTTLKDTAPPQLVATNPLFTAPEGWVEQKSYLISPIAQDSGYGVTYMALKIDGATVASRTEGCPNGGCGSLLWHSVDMTQYKGGAHSAELIATDAAGNSSKKPWTINVDPKGDIPLAEATDTFEAIEDTTTANLIEESGEEELPGTAPGLGVEPASDSFTTTGSEVPTEIAGECADGIAMDVLAEDPIESEGQAGEGAPAVSNIEFAPINTGAAASEMVSNNATVCTDTSDHVDTIVRPLFDGTMTFQAIRDKAGAETFSWEVLLYPDQELKAIDNTRAAVYFANGYLAFTISTIPAHDAVGTSVPTKLTVSEGKVITLRVEHRAASLVYPVIAGAGWEGGFITHQVVMPPPEIDPLAFELVTHSTLLVGAPEAVPADEADASTSSLRESRRKYAETICGLNLKEIEGKGIPIEALLTSLDCGNAFTGDLEPVSQ